MASRYIAAPFAGDMAQFATCTSVGDILFTKAISSMQEAVRPQPVEVYFHASDGQFDNTNKDAPALRAAIADYEKCTGGLKVTGIMCEHEQPIGLAKKCDDLGPLAKEVGLPFVAFGDATLFAAKQSYGGTLGEMYGQISPKVDKYCDRKWTPVTDPSAYGAAVGDFMTTRLAGAQTPELNGPAFGGTGGSVCGIEHTDLEKTVEGMESTLSPPRLSVLGLYC